MGYFLFNFNNRMGLRNRRKSEILNEKYLKTYKIAFYLNYSENSYFLGCWTEVQCRSDSRKNGKKKRSGLNENTN